MNVLVLSQFCGTNANTIRDYLYSFNAYSRNRFYYVHRLGILNRRFDFSRFDALVLFWSYPWPWMKLSDDVVERIAAAPGLKVMFLQDEYREVHRANESMRRLGVQVMCTLTEERDHTTFYPVERIPTLRATHTVLTGYVPAYLERMQSPPHDRRPVDVSYRSRIVPYFLGDLAQEKQIIAERFQEIARRYELTSDISVWEGDRLYGRKYLQFLLRSRCVLGTESGSSVVDFTGEIQRACEEHVRRHPHASYQEVKARCFADQDGVVENRAISPRIFESAALRNTMVLHEGRYQDIVRPDEHYISVRKDYSNIDEVVRRIRDRRFCEHLAERAHQDLVASGRYSYRAFVGWFDGLLDNQLRRAVGSGAPSRATFYAWNFARHGQGIIPHRDRYVRIPTVDYAYALTRTMLMKCAWFLVRRMNPHSATHWGLKPALRSLLVTTWGRLPGSARTLLRPMAQPVRQALRRINVL